MANARQLIIFGAVTLVALVMIVSARNIMLGETVSVPYTGNAVMDSSATNYDGEVQKVKLSMANYEYQLSPSTLKRGVPVEMEVDMSTVYGCMRDVVIPGFNVKKYVSESDNIIKFTPTKSGEFNIACSMNMGRGTFSVAEEDGSKANYVEPAPAAVGGESCGGEGGAGGCGCGGV